MRGAFTKKSILLIGTTFLLLLGVVGGNMYEQNKNQFLSKLQSFNTMFERYDQLMNPNIKHLKDDSRTQILIFYIDLWLQKPILGYGIGANYYYKQNDGGSNKHQISSHNQLVNTMVDFGLFGLLLYITFCLSLISYNTKLLLLEWNIFLLLAFLLYSFVSHTLLRDFNMFFVYAFIARLNQYAFNRTRYNIYEHKIRSSIPKQLT